MTGTDRQRTNPLARRRVTFAISGVFLVLILSALAAALSYSRSDRFRSAQENTVRETFQVARNLNVILQTATLVLDNEVALRVGAVPDLTSAQATQDRLVAIARRWPLFASLMLVGPNNDIIATTSDANASAMLLRDYQDANGAGVASGIFLGQHTSEGGNSLIVLRPLKTGALVGTISLASLAAVHRDMHLPQGAVLTIFRGDDLTPVISEPPLFSRLQPIVQDTAELRRAIAGGSDGVLTESSMADGSTQILCFERLETAGLFAAVSLPRSTVRLLWRGDVILASILAALAVLAVLTVTGFVLYQMRLGRKAKGLLEDRVRERTAELETLNRQLETLFREVHHRVKNNLQIVTSLLSLQSSRLTSGPAKEALQDSVNRVYSMSLVHDMLYNERETANIDCSQYVATLASRLGDAFATTDRVSVEVTGGRLTLDLGSAIPLALICNEVISNALKHAFPGDRRGRIVIDIQPEQQFATLVVTDDGIGYHSDADGDGMGLKMLEALARQIEAETSVKSGAGTEFRIRFPIPQAST